MISVRDVHKVFHSGRPNEFTALRGISLEILPHQTTVLKGPSGSGKTTLLALLGCMSRPTSGRIFLNSREVTSLPERFLTGIRRSSFGFIFQHFNLIKGISVLENVMAPAYPTGERRVALKGRALALLEMFGVERKAEAKVDWLSGGEAQRVAIARALINNPAAIIADEPTAHLDSRLALEFIAMVNELKQKGTTVIMASHDPIVFGSPVADRVVELRDGMLVGEESR